MSATFIVSHYFLVNDVLTDVTTALASGVDASGTYGVRRNDTYQSIVAPGTNLTHDGTGIYSIEVDGAIPGVTYGYAFDLFYNGFHYKKTGTKTIPDAITISPSGTQLLATLITTDPHGNIQSLIPVQFKLIKTSVPGISPSSKPFTQTSDTDGLINVELIQSSTYQGRRGVSAWREFVTPAETEFLIDPIVGME